MAAGIAGIGGKASHGAHDHRGWEDDRSFGCDGHGHFCLLEIRPGPFTTGSGCEWPEADASPLRL